MLKIGLRIILGRVTIRVVTTRLKRSRIMGGIFVGCDNVMKNKIMV